jgi:hypothetical protein
MVGDKQKTSVNEIKGFLSLQLELRLELGFRLRLTKISKICSRLHDNLLGTVDPKYLEYHDFVEVGARLATQLREEGCDCDAVVALTHMRTENDLRLANSEADFDLILAGHDHNHDVVKGDTGLDIFGYIWIYPNIFGYIWINLYVFVYDCIYFEKLHLCGVCCKLSFLLCNNHT